jgi:hypothetical protein
LDDPTQALETALDELKITRQAQMHYASTSSYQAVLANKYDRLHRYYAPLNGDQWPEDLARRPGMIHVTHNIVQPAVDTESRIESLLPKISNIPLATDPESRTRAEAAEKLILHWLELSGWDIWLTDAAKVKSMYGKVVLKPYWQKRDKRGDVSVIEDLQNLRLGWGSSNYDELDWALYEYTLSPLQVMAKFPELEVIPVRKGGRKLFNVIRHADHSDPLQQLPAGQDHRRTRQDVQPSDYEEGHLKVWDYWTKTVDADGQEHITNAFFVEGKLASSPKNHDYYPDLPFIVIEHDHEPGSPEGLGDIEPLIDLQIEINRAISHWAQLIADEIDPAWQINADSVPAGLVPRGGEILPVGEDREVKPFEKQVNQFPIRELVEGLMEAFHFRSGLSEILFAAPPSGQTAGRALAIQIEASANRIDPRRRRFYRGIVSVILFWIYMAEKVNPDIVIGADEQGNPQTEKLAAVLAGFRRWKVTAPEITPRDNAELITAVVNKLNAKLISLEDAMDELGVDSPLEMIQKIEQERMNPRLFPGDTQAYVAVLTMLLQMQQMQAAMGAQPQVPSGDGTGQMMADAQAAQPQGVQGQNGSDVPQPATAAGGPPPPGAPGPGGLQNQTLIRANEQGGADALQQIRVMTGG